MAQKINIHSILPFSLVNGPGKRGVVWMQGCPFNCKGCFNQAARSLCAGNYFSAREVCDSFTVAAIEGITISGGEPFYQPAALIALCEEIRQRGWTIVLYSGYTINQIRDNADHRFRQVLDYADILIDGPYRQEIAPETLWAGSGNQQVYFLSGRYQEYRKLIFTKERYEEIYIDETGTVSVTGF